MPSMFYTKNHKIIIYVSNNYTCYIPIALYWIKMYVGRRPFDVLVLNHIVHVSAKVEFSNNHWSRLHELLKFLFLSKNDYMYIGRY